MTVKFFDFGSNTLVDGEVNETGLEFIMFNDNDVVFDVEDNNRHITISIDDLREIVKFWDEHPKLREGGK